MGKLNHREGVWLSYVLTGVYGAVAWYWYRKGRNDGVTQIFAEASDGLSIEDEPPCEDCPDPAGESPTIDPANPGEDTPPTERI